MNGDPRPGGGGRSDSPDPSGQLKISSIEARADSTDPEALTAAMTELAALAAMADSTDGIDLPAIAAHLPLTIYSLDRNGVVTSCYGGALGRLGLKDGDLVGLDLTLFGPDVAASFEQVLAGEVTGFNIDGMGPDGQRWVSHVVITPLPGGQGAFAVALDQTDQILALEQVEHQRLLHESAVAALHDSEARFRILAEYAPIGVFIVGPDRHLQYLNPAGCETIGRTFDEVEHLSWIELIHPDDRDGVLGELSRQSDDVYLVVPCRIVQPDGSVRWVRLRAVDVADEDGEIAGYVGTAADITESVQVEQTLREGEERYRAILETAAEGIVTVDESGLIVEFNAAAERIFGYDSDEAIGQMRAGDLLHLSQRLELIESFAAYVNGDIPPMHGVIPIEIAGLTKSGDQVPIEVALAQLDTANGRLFTSVIRDISERKAFERELEHLATHDPLTGLPNRALLLAQLEASLERAQRHRSSVAVLFVDIERVKLVSEALGHRAGDELIVQAARRIEAVLDESAVLSRFSGDEFVVHSEECDDVADAVEMATAIIETINEPFEVAGDDVFVSATVGIAFAPHGAGTAESLMSNADVAANRAHESSITRYEVFDPDMRAWVDSRRKLEVALRHGIDRGEFELYYQPVVALGSGVVQGVEALVRWNHPHLGLLPPDEFIPLAEDSDLIVPLGDWIVGEACRQLATWQRTHPRFGVSVNLSARQIALPGFAERVGAALLRSGADPGGLSFEITETVLLEDVEAASHTLGDLKALGSRVALDDFGTGYSSLTNLVQLPIDVVKIDRSFVEHLDTGGPGTTIVAMVVSLGETLRLDVVAEGVETEAQRRALIELGCRSAQGFLFARPSPASALDGPLAAGGLIGLPQKEPPAT